MSNDRLTTWGLQWVDAARDACAAALVGELGGQSQGYLAVIALHNARTAVVAVLGEQHEAVALLDGRVADLKQCRDMLSHFEEYVSGSGRLQAKASGVEAPWLPMWSGSGNSNEVAFHTEVGNPPTPRTYFVNLQDALTAISRALVTAINETKGEGASPLWLRELAGTP